MQELNIADRFYIDANLDKTTVELAEILKKPSTSIEIYLAVQKQKEYDEQRRHTTQKNQQSEGSPSPSPLSSSVDSEEIINLDADAPKKPQEVIKATEKKSILRESFARRGTFTAMTSAAGMISDEIYKDKGSTPYKKDEVITVTGR